MVLAAIDRGFHTLGFSSHSHLDGEAWTLRDPAAYRAEIQRLAEVYREKLAVVCGVEWDWDSSAEDREGYQYVIGSVHRIQGPCTGQKYEMDHTLEEILNCRDREFGGDGIAMTQHYFSVIEQMIDTKPDILGHMDLPRKQNLNNRIFDETNPQYIQAALHALEKAAKAGILVEMNTGVSFRGYRDDYYPAERLLPAFAEMGGRLILTSDTHDPRGLGWQFDLAAQKAKKAGFRTLYQLTGHGFEEVEIE